MNKQALARITKKQSEKQTLLSIGLLCAAINGVIITPVSAQSMDQSAFLPPEVIPVNSAVNYSSAPASNSAAPGMGNNNPSNANASGSPAVGMQPRLQTAQDYRSALFNSLKGTSFEPQPQVNQSMVQASNNQAGLAANWPGSNNSQLGQSNLISPNQANNSINTFPTQTQTLSGSVNAASGTQTRPNSSNGLAHVIGLASLFGMGAMGLAGMRGSGSYYNTGIMGPSLINSGMRSGFMW